jgi:hypothetical protein
MMYEKSSSADGGDGLEENGEPECLDPDPPPILTTRSQLLSSQAIHGLSHTILQIKGIGSLMAVNELRLTLAPLGLHSRS